MTPVTKGGDNIAGATYKFILSKNMILQSIKKTKYFYYFFLNYLFILENKNHCKSKANIHMTINSYCKYYHKLNSIEFLKISKMKNIINIFSYIIFFFSFTFLLLFLLLCKSSLKF